MSELKTLEEVWDELRKNPETKATMEEADKTYKLFKQIEEIMLTDAENKIKNLKQQLADQREQICDEIRVMINADPTIAEDYFRVMAIISHVEKGGDDVK